MNLPAKVWGCLESAFFFYIDESDELDGTVLYHIIYDEDWDADNMIEEECGTCIAFYRKLENGEINEWEIGGYE